MDDLKGKVSGQFGELTQKVSGKFEDIKAISMHTTVDRTTRF